MNSRAVSTRAPKMTTCARQDDCCVLRIEPKLFVADFEVGDNELKVENAHLFFLLFCDASKRHKDA